MVALMTHPDLLAKAILAHLNTNGATPTPPTEAPPHPFYRRENGH